MEKNIQIYDLPIEKLGGFFTELFIDREYYGLPQKYAEAIVEKHLQPFLTHLKEGLSTIVEFPYVDKMYRDSFYFYYSSKLHLNERDTIRVSFFSESVDSAEFRNAENYEELKKKYLGFLVIRPTFPKIIGRSAISPKAIRNQSFICCQAEISATVNSLKFKISAFPHASQDSQAITCAETTIWSLLEYFGNKYPEYKPVLPSQINKILQKYSYKRQLPSDGLTAEQVTYAVRELGFGAMIYSQSKHGEEFNSVVSIFVESGIPVIGVLKNDELAHAVNIIGREADDKKIPAQEGEPEDIGNGKMIIDYHKIKRNYILIDDNHPPYQHATLEKPWAHYGETNTKWHDCRLTNIIVPLYSKIYLDAIRAKKNFKTVLKDEKLGIKDEKPRILKVFLASSRSYKEYLALNADLDDNIKGLILGISMPKFIWIAEMSHPESFTKGKIDSILIQDATEPVEYTDETNLTEMPVFCGYIEGRFFSFLNKKFNFFNTFAIPFEAFKANLN